MVWLTKLWYNSPNPGYSYLGQVRVFGLWFYHTIPQLTPSKNLSMLIVPDGASAPLLWELPPMCCHYRWRLGCPCLMVVLVCPAGWLTEGFAESSSQGTSWWVSSSCDAWVVDWWTYGFIRITCAYVIRPLPSRQRERCWPLLLLRTPPPSGLYHSTAFVVIELVVDSCVCLNWTNCKCSHRCIALAQVFFLGRSTLMLGVNEVSSI